MEVGARDVQGLPRLAHPVPGESNWDQAQISFRFVKNIPAGMAKRKESLIQTFYETSAAHFADWLTFAEWANQKYFRYLFFQYANFSNVGKLQTRLIFSPKNKTVSTITFNFLRD